MLHLQSTENQPPVRNMNTKHVLELDEDEAALLLSSRGPEIFVSGDVSEEDRRRVALLVWALNSPLVEEMVNNAMASA